MTGRAFPSGFVWGAATSSYQIEGATNESGRGQSIWDRFVRVRGSIRGGDTGDVACDHYHRYREDAALVAALGLNAYRFSIAWPRVIPRGIGRVNEAGLDFYDRLVDALLGNGVAPFACLYHWDLPQPLEDAGGWAVRATAEAFAEYAGIVAKRLGDRVPQFATLNEPYVVSELGYRRGIHAPGRRERSAANAAAHHLLVAHGLAVAAIRAVAPAANVGIVLDFEPKHPATDHPLDVEAAAVAHSQMNRFYLDPLRGRNYPGDAVAAWRWTQREVQAGDMELIARPIDFLGVNYYTRHVVRSPRLRALAKRNGVERTSMGWEVYPEGLGEILDFVASRTRELPLFVTENGAAYADDPAEPTRDPARVNFLRRHLEAALDAIGRGVPLRGYFAWSLLDNFEWTEGYAERFGIVRVDYATQERQVRDSGRFLGAVARTGHVPDAVPNDDEATTGHPRVA